MNINDITKSEVLTSVSQLIDLCEEQDSESRTHRRVWAYRGQARDFGTLVPSFQREFSRQSFGTAQVIERQLIEAFRKHYEELKDRSADMPTPNQITVGRDLRCLSVMQHYEIPTRLLDWTSSFWTAIYFACAGQLGHKAELWTYDRGIFEKQRSDNPALQSLLDKSKTPPPEPNVLIQRGEGLVFELDPQITPRMEKQFAHHTVSENVFADHGPLLYKLQISAAPPVDSPFLLRRYLIDAPCKVKALQFLEQHKGITASTIFPDVVGLGRYLRWQFESLRTMLL